MHFKSFSVLLLISLLTVSCSGGKRAKYKDTRYLEVPPRINVIEKSNVLLEEDEKLESKGLGNKVSLVSRDNKSIIKIKKTFERSWEIVEQAIKLNEIEETDKDRELGVFYVTFDPDDQTSDGSTLFDRMTFSFFKNEYEKASYKLTVVWQESDTEVTAERVDSETNELIDNDDASTDIGSKLLSTLYKTIRDDLPVN